MIEYGNRHHSYVRTTWKIGVYDSKDSEVPFAATNFVRKKN